MTTLPARPATASVATPTRFLVLWQPERGAGYRIVGVLTREPDGYSFAYEQDLPAGFTRFVSMPDDRVYHSPRLFSMFTNRVISPRRDSLDHYLSALGLDPATAHEPFELMGLCLGERQTDVVQVLPIPDVEDSRLTLRFLVHGGRHVDPDAHRLAGVHAGDHLALSRETDNEHSRLAVLVGAKTPVIRGNALGYVPEPLAGLVGGLLNHEARAWAEHVTLPHPDEPWLEHMRLLVGFEARVDDRFDPMAFARLTLPGQAQ